MTKKIIAGLVGMLLMGFAAEAEAASCPAAPPLQIAFEAPPSPLAQDATNTAKQVATKRDPSATDRFAPAFYDAGTVTTSRRDTAIAKLPDGTVCAALAKLTVKITLERKLWLASELNDNECVLKAFAAQYGQRSTTDDEVIAAFGKTVSDAYKVQVAAIGWQTAKTQDEAVKLIADKLAPIMTQINDKFLAERTAAQMKLDLSKMPSESCDGATEKLGHKVGVGNG